MRGTKRHSLPFVIVIMSGSCLMTWRRGHGPDVPDGRNFGRRLTTIMGVACDSDVSVYVSVSWFLFRAEDSEEREGLI